MDDSEILQFVASQNVQDVPDDLFEIPCLPKRRRLRQKTNVSPESIPIHSGSSLDESAPLTKNERKRFAKAKKAADAKADHIAALLHLTSLLARKSKNL